MDKSIVTLAFLTFFSCLHSFFNDFFCILFEMPYLPISIKEKIVEVWKNGMKTTDLAKQFGCSERTVKRPFKQSKIVGSLHRAAKSGRHSSTKTAEDRSIIGEFKENPSLTSTDGSRLYKLQFSKDISARTVRRRLIKAKLYARRPIKKPRMTPRIRKLRLVFARRYQSWTSDDWSRVIFFDETKVNLYQSDGPPLIRRPIGKRLLLKYIKPTLRFGGGSIMCWGMDCYSFPCIIVNL